MPTSNNTFATATGGYDAVPRHWVPATGLRSLILDDPALLWLQFHGAKHGFRKDPPLYDFLTFIGRKGCEFEDKWTKEVAPEAVAVLVDDREVRQVGAFSKTLKCLAEGHDVISHGALWWSPEKIYGAPDLIVKASWLRRKFPHLAPYLEGADHYVILDCKFMTGLDNPSKAKELQIVSAQVRLYSFMLGKIQGYKMPRWAFLATRDRPFDPMPVEVGHEDGKGLDSELAALRDQYRYIKTHGASLRPWKDSAVAANFSNDKDAPWHLAKKQIAREYIPGGPVEWLPHVGSKQAAALRCLGVTCLDDVMQSDVPVPFHTLCGLGHETARRIGTVLAANKTGRPSDIPAALVPSQRDIELFIDYEYLTDVNVDFDRQWPKMEGCDMIFMVGIAFREAGEWQFRHFVAAHETPAAERDMLMDFGRFLKKMGVFDTGRSASLYHWSAAEVWQSERAAERHGLEYLVGLPWVDLQVPFRNGPIGLPGAWGFGLKEIATSLPPDYRVKWPEGLGIGLAAMVAGFTAYRQPQAKETPEIRLLSDYLKVDCVAIGQVLRWMRSAVIEKQPARQRETRGYFWYRSHVGSGQRPPLLLNEALTRELHRCSYGDASSLAAAGGSVAEMRSS